jgi:hypothetical protein
MKRRSITICLIVLTTIQLLAQQSDLPVFSGKYFGQSFPGITPEVFAPGIVSTKNRVYANVTFNSNLTEACWTPNSNDSTYKWQGGIIFTKQENGIWSSPKEIRFLGSEYSHRSPFYDYNSKRLYFQAHLKSDQGWDQKEKFLKGLFTLLSLLQLKQL